MAERRHQHQADRDDDARPDGLQGDTYGAPAHMHHVRDPADVVANACVEACYLGDAAGRAIHLLGPLAGKVVRVSPPLVMPLDEARDYLDAMFGIFSSVAQKLTRASR